MATWRDFNSPDADNFLRSVSSQFQGPAAQAIAGSRVKSMLREQEDSQNQQIAQQQEQQKQAVAQQKELERQQQAAGKAQQEEHERNLRRAAAQGAVVQTDVESGEKVVATHADGSTRFKPGPIDQPKEQIVVDRKLVEGLGLKGTPFEKTLGEPADYSGKQLVQTYRDDRGGMVERSLPAETDPKTAEIYTKVDDPVTGLQTRRVLGTDPVQQARLQQSAQLEQERQKLDLRSNAIKQERMRFDPSWEPAKREFDEAGTALNGFKPTFRRNTESGAWEKIDPKTDAPVIHDPRELAVWQREKEQVTARYDRAKRVHDRLFPEAERLNTAERKAREESLLLAERRIRLESGLPDDDGGTAAILAKTSGQIEELPFEPAVNAVTGGFESSQGQYPMGEIDSENDAWFKANPGTTGMAWGGGMNGSPKDSPRTVLLNPYSNLTKEQQEGVAVNERLRHFMDEKKPNLAFEITPEQRKAFEGTEYGKPGNEKFLRETIVARILTGDESSGNVTPDQERVASEVWKNFKGQTSKPLLSAETDAEAVKSAFGALRGIEGLQAEQRNGWTALNRDGRHIASIQDGGGSPVVILEDAARESDDINRTIALGQTKGVPLYLRDNGKLKNVTDEASSVAAVFQALGDPSLRDPATGKASPALLSRIDELGATPEKIKARVNSGDLSLQHGQALLKDIYGETLESPDPQAPKTFADWIEKTSRSETDGLRAKYGNPALKAETTADRWSKAKKGNGFSLADQNQIWNDFIRDQYVANRGKPGVTREKYQALMRMDASDKATTSEKAASALTAARKMVVNDVAGSMFGLAAGAAKDLGAAEVALFGNEDAAKTVAESMKLRNRDLANWTDGAKRNAKIWVTDEGRKVSGEFESATNAFRRVIDEQEDSGNPDAAAIAAAEQRVRSAALALHSLAPDSEWPITDAHLDPDKDGALGGALARYKANGDPREFELYKERLLMSNGRRQFSAEMEKKMRGKSGFNAAVTGGMYAGWQELGTEMIADASILVTGGGSKAIQAGLRGAGAVGKAERLARLGTRIGQAIDRVNEIGIRAETLANPLTRGQRITNAAVRTVKTGVQGAAGEAGEEIISEAGSDSPDFARALGVGLLGGGVMTPAFYPMQRAAESAGEAANERAIRAGNREFANRYNATMAGAPGFQPINEETAAAARVLVNPDQFQSQLARVDEAARAVGGFSNVEEDPAAVKRVENLRSEISRAESALEKAPADRATAIEAQLASMREQEQSLSASIPADDTTARMKARKDLDEAIEEMAISTERSVAAANEIQSITDPAQKTFLTGIAKAVTGNIGAITQNERAAIQGARTEAGAAYFEGDTITAEARAEMLVKFPAVGSLIQTPESQAIVSAQLETPQTNGTQVTDGARNPAEAQSLPGVEQSAEAGASTEAVSDPAPEVDSQRGEIRPSAPTAVNPAELDAGEYEAYRASNPRAPDIGTVVRSAIEAGNPVSVSMARAAGIDSPEGYTRRGAILTPPERVAVPAETEQVSADVSQSESDSATPRAVEQARAAIERVTARMPSLAGKFIIDDGAATGQTAGGYATQDEIVINLADLDRELAGFSPEDHAARVDAILQEEIIHFAQFEAVRRNGEDVVSFYDSLWKDLTPEQQRAAAATYQGEFDSMPEWAKAAETVRMFIQQRADGSVTELTKAFSKNMPERLLSLLRSAAEFLRSMVTAGEIPQRIQDAIAGIEAVLAEFESESSSRESNPLDTASTANPPQAVTGMRIESGSEGISRVMRDNSMLWEGPAADADAQLAELQAAEFSPLRVSGLAIASARERFPEIKGKLRQQLEYLTEDIADAIESLPPDERRGAVDRAIDEWMADRNTKPAARSIDAPAKTTAFQVLNSGEYPALTALFQSGTKIAPRPNMISLILARRKSGAKLTNREIDLLQNNPEYDGAVFQNQFANSGTGKIAREIVSILTARQGEGTRPDVMAGYLGGGLTASDMWGRIGKELNAIATGSRLGNQAVDPNRERTEAEISAELSAPQKQSRTERQESTFEAANVPENGEAFYVEDFTTDSVGATVTVDGEEMRVTAVNMDSLGTEVESVVLDDHTRFGRQVLESGEVVYVQAGEVDAEALFSSPSPGALRADLVSAFNRPPKEYSFQSSDERRPAIQEILVKFGLRSVHSADLDRQTRRFAERTGASPIFYKAGKIQITGFVSQRNPELIFINAERDDVPLSWTLSHELVHVAQKDPAANARQILATIADLLTDEEFRALENTLLQRRYRIDELETEIPAFLMADAVSGHQDIGLDTFTRGAELREALIKHFDELPYLRPETLSDSIDDDLGVSDAIDRSRKGIASEGIPRVDGLDAGPDGQAPPSLSSSPSLDFGVSGGFNTRNQLGFDFAERTENAAAITDPEPTEAQIEAGNYRKGKVTLHGMRISIENARGSTRSGVDSKGNPWSVDLAHHYGYFLGTTARDGDHVDVFVGPNPDSEKVFVVNQVKTDTGRFDEHKVMMGFNTRREAIDGYLANYSPGWKGLGDMVETDVASLKAWLEGDTTKPAKKADFGPQATPQPKLAVRETSGISDFGEKIGGARKDQWAAVRESISGDLPEKMADFTMAKNFPEPNWQKLIDGGESVKNIAALKALRDMIPRKPGSNWKIQRWGELVKTLHGFAQKVISGDMDFTDDRSTSIIAKFPNIERQIQFYQDLGFPAILGAKDWKLERGRYHQYRNLTPFPGRETTVDVLHARLNDRDQGAEFYGLANDSATMGKIIESVRARIVEATIQPQTRKPTEFNVYMNRGSGEHYIAKKIPGKVVRIKGGFDAARDAFDWMKENRPELETMWEAMKADPVLRRVSNMPREGTTVRDGDVTPELFQAAFGFRGVEFGNWVEDSRRQADLNEAYDALTDLAEVLGVPTKAISLDGSLGLAFGARGHKGASAHYEPGKVVINLTKKSGAGALAHEWFHALDNYFARLDKTGSTTPASLGRFATESGREPAMNARPEVWTAFDGIRKAIEASEFKKRSVALDDFKSKPYYGTTIEMAARAFEKYVVDKLSAMGASNDYLANIDRSSDAFPTDGEMKDGIARAYDDLWNVMDTRESERGVMLFSSPSPDTKAAVDAALSAMPPIYRQVFEAVSGGAAPEEVMKRFSISERAVTNILNQVRARITAAMGAASAEGLVPVMRDGKFDGGRPDLALSTIPAVAAIDQIRNESGIPDVRGWDEVNAEADKMLANYQGTFDALLAKARDLQPMTDTEVAAAKKIIAKETLAGKIQTPADRVKLAMLIHGYRDIGTETARSLAIRRDPTQKPAQRHAQFIAEALFTPDPETRDLLRKASTGQAESILAGWMARVDSIKSDLIAQGIDIDASLAAFRATEEKRKQSEADSPRVKAVLDQTIRKLSKREKAVIEAIRSGALLSKAAFLTGMSNAEVKEVYSRFITDIRSAMAESAKRYLEGSLASSPTDMMTAILADLGLPDISLIDDTVPGFKDRRNEKPKKPRESKKPEAPAPPTDAQKAKWDRLAEEFFARPMSTWRTLWQDEMKKLDPIFAQKNFDFKESDFIQPWKDFWQTEMPGVAWSEPKFKEWAGAQPARKQAVLDLFKAKLNEIRGTWSEDRPFSGQGEFFREEINETTGTFDLNDPVAVKAVIDAFAIARGRKMDALMEFWRASILTGPQTHIVNAASNTINAAYNLLPKRAAEATINALLGIVGQGSEKAATLAEFKPMAQNLRKGFQLAARNALRSWQIEGRVFDSYARAEALQLEFTGVGSEYVPPALGGKLGKVMRSLSFRAMTAADEFMKSIYAQMEAAAQAHRIAKLEEKLTGPAYEARLAELMQPGSVAWIRAVDEAKRVTFQEDLDGTNPRAIARLDQLAELAKRGRNMPWIGRPLTFFLPFVDTPLNVFKQAIEMSPIGGFLAVLDGARALRRRVYRGDIPKEVAAAEAAKLYDRARLVRDITNQTLGVAAFIAIQGLVTPDEDDELPAITGTVPYKTTKRGERDNAYAVMPPQSIRIGNLRFSYARVEPFATFLASTVDLMVETNRHGGFKPEVASQWLSRFKDGAKDKTFLQGVSDLLNALEDPDRFAERLTANIATGFIPNLIRQPIRESDKFIRDQNPRADEGFMTAVGKRVGYSIVPQAAPAKMDVWGNDVLSNPGELIGGTRPTDMLFRILDPTNAQLSVKPDPLDLWIFRYNLETADSKDRIAIQPISNAIRGQVPGERHSRTFALTSEEQAEANREAGQMARAILGEGWANRERSYSNAKLITDAVSEAQQAIRERIKVKKITGIPASP